MKKMKEMIKKGEKILWFFFDTYSTVVDGTPNEIRKNALTKGYRNPRNVVTMVKMNI